MRALTLLSICLLWSSAALSAESKKASDYPLRIHIYRHTETTFYYDRVTQEAKGDGRANLFENGEARGVDFSFECSEKVKNSFGYETYPAKWKKPGQELVVLLPVFGQANTFNTCTFKTDMKDHAYRSHNGRLGSEAVDKFRAWMVKHDYDPEHGKNAPVNLAAGEAAAETAEPVDSAPASPTAPPGK